MESKVCMNGFCKANSSIKWRDGWDLRCGGFANLCDKCGVAYEQLDFCETFHLKESGWRECHSCGKRLHCGCVASKSLVVLLDDGGVECISCMKRYFCSLPSDQKANGKVLQMDNGVVENKQISLPESLKNEPNGTLCQVKINQNIPSSVEETGCIKTPVEKPEVAEDLLPKTTAARTPVEVRGRNYSRYRPRTTEQELQQIPRDYGRPTTMVPLFEKVLTASDTNKIGRIVLPKACAEAYFPPLSQASGRPLKIQDTKGNEWVFQYRFWPNNKSRMYVLDGIAACLKSMQLQAGDAVTFSRLEPKGTLVIGSRKASNSGTPQVDSRKRKVATSEKPAQEPEEESSYGLETLATLAVLGGNLSDSSSPSIDTEVNNRRHFLGCRCIECVQPWNKKDRKHNYSRTCE